MVGMKSHAAIGQIQGVLTHGAFGHLTDAELLELFVQHGDSDAAFETLILRHGPAVLRTCRRFLGDRGEADDAFQATFLVLARRARSLHPQHSVGPWLQGVARRIALKARTAAIRRHFHEQKTAVSILFDAETRFELSETLREEVDRLPHHLRAPIVLCYFEQMSYKSAARKLGVTTATVRGRLAKARELLKPRISRHLGRSGQHTVPLALLGATTRLARAFSNTTTQNVKIVSSILNMADGALKMMFVTRIMRVFVVLLLGAAGTAFVGLKTSGGELAERTARVSPQSAGTEGIAVANRETPREIAILAQSIRAKSENDEICVDGPGSLSLWVDRGFLTNSIQDLAKGPQSEPTLLKISWSNGMLLLGRTTDEGRPCARAEFRGKIIAQIDDSSIRCEERMTIRTLEPISFERIQIVLKGLASNGLVRHPQTKIARIDAFRKVVAIGSIIDPARHVLAHRQTIQCDDSLIFDSRTGEYHVSGKGKVFLDDPTPAAQAPLKDSAPPAGIREISFSNGMMARPGSATKREAGDRLVEIYGDVTISCETTTDRNEKRQGYLTAEKVRLVVESQPRDANSHHRYHLRFEALGRARMVSGHSSADSENFFVEISGE
jgi:RNA polymerase sigma factor (sigma-70 family)